MDIQLRLPLAVVEPAQRQDLLEADAGFRHGGEFQPHRLTGNGVEIQAENDLHGLSGIGCAES
jgi:hypothetical protein